MTIWAVFMRSASGWKVVRRDLTFHAAMLKVKHYQAMNPSFEYCVNTL